MSSDLDILRRLPAFADLSPEEGAATLRVLKARRGAPGDVLFQEGDAGDTMYMVLDGELAATVRDGNGAPQEVAQIRRGEVAGEMAFVDQTAKRSASLVAKSVVTVLVFSRAALAQLRQTTPRAVAALNRALLGDVARRLRDTGARLEGSSPLSFRTNAAPASMRGGRTVTVAELRAAPILANAPQEDIDLLSYISTMRTFQASDSLMVQGAQGDACFFILRGEVEITRKDDGDLKSLATLGPGAIVGQLALLDRAPRSATVTATRSTDVLELRADAFANLLRSHSPIALRFQEQIAVAGVRQLRVATQSYADASRRAAENGAFSQGNGGMLDDWDDDAPPLELAIDPRDIRR